MLFLLFAQSLMIIAIFEFEYVANNVLGILESDEKH